MSTLPIEAPRTRTVVLNADCKRFLAFCAAYLQFVEGEVAGQPMTFEPWMIANCINPIFERGEDGKRRFNVAYIQLAKGNMKSTLGAALAIFMLVVEGANTKGFQVWAIAASKDQAKVVFNNAKAMVEASPRLLDFITVQRDSLYIASTRAIFRVSSSDAPKKHGVRPNVVICDELHAHEDGLLYEAFLSAMITATEGLMVVITNPGADERNSKCGEVYRLGKSGEDPAMYFWAPESDPDDESTWKRANPASYITIAKLRAQKRRMPPFAFARWHCNVWTRGIKQWLAAGAWDACEGGAKLIDGETVIIGIDMARRYDSAAMVIVAPRGGKFVVQAETWAIWDDPSKPPPNVHHVIEGDSIPFNIIFDRIRELCSQFNVVECPYDPWRIPDKTAEELEAEGLPMVRFDQNITRMGPASNGLFKAVSGREIVHDGDPVLAGHISAAGVSDYGGDRGWKLTHDKATDYMDAAIALAIAVDRASQYMDAGDGSDPFLVRYVG